MWYSAWYSRIYYEYLHIYTFNDTYIHFAYLHFLAPFLLCPPGQEIFVWTRHESLKINLPLSLTELIHQFTLYASCMCMWWPHLRFIRAVFSGYTALLPLTGMWYLISFQNLEEGEREGDSLCMFSSHFSSWASLRHVRHLCRCLWFFHQHTAPCFFLRWRTDSGNRANWAGLISSSSTRITCKEGVKLESRSLFWTHNWGETTLIEALK